MASKKQLNQISKALMKFIDASPTPFHATHNMSSQLDTHGFKHLKESEEWKIKPGGRYYTTRDDSSIIAWIAGAKHPAYGGFKIIGAHTDSPNLRLKPNAAVCKHGYHQVGVEEYGGVLLSSWTDRDLSLAGRVITRQRSGELKSELILLKDALLRIPLLAIHLNRDVNGKGLLLNRQDHMPPVLGLESSSESHPLLPLIAKTLKQSEESILGYDLSLYDLQPSSYLGCQNEFIAAPRLDNLFSCFCALEALCEHAESSYSGDASLMMACFDHEEIGSVTSQGARSSLLETTLERINEASPKAPKQAMARAMAHSIFVSADMAHAVHPNYAEKHEPQHFPKMNQGPVIKTNAQGRYATSGFSSAMFEALCQDLKVSVQKFVNRTDLGCGSTIGPFVASNLGIPTIDVGAAMLSMHSIREMCGSHDVMTMKQAFYRTFASS